LPFHSVNYRHCCNIKNQKLTVEVFSEDGKHLLGNGHLAFIDNNVNPQTGTVLLKAEVPNAKELLWPGLMVKTNLILTTEAKAIVVPMKAIQVGQEGNFVYQVIDHKAVSTPVTGDRQVDELAVISKGLRGNETILTVIPPNMTDDVPVKISEANE
jgi:multidrug efflux system membrane fusion protein